MPTTSKTYRLLAGLLAAMMILSSCTTGTAQQPTEDNSNIDSAGNTPATASSLGYAAEMDKDSVLSVEITADPDEWLSMLDNATAKEYISVDITINGTNVKNVGIRPKGNSSLSSVAQDDESDRYSFKLKLDEYVDGQTWLGLDELVLNSGFSDATAMKEYLSYDIMNYIGVDTPLYAFTNISVNGETWGLYLAVEDYEGSYLERAKNNEGEMYKPESADGMGNMNREDMQLPEGMEMPENGERPEGFQPPEGMEMPEGFDPSQMPEGFGGDGERPQWNDGGNGGGGEGRGPGGMGADDGVALIYTDDEESSYSSIFDNDKTKTDQEDHQRVIEAIKNLNEGTDLETYVDVDSVLRYLAAHTVVVNLDSYSGSMGHNYILYENDGQISILPWDYNMAFGGFMSGDADSVVNLPIDTPVSGVSMEDRPLISKLLEVPEYLEKYHGYLQEIMDGYFADGAFEAKIDSINALIGDYIKSDPTAFYTYDEYQAAITELKKLGSLRAESIQGQLDGSIPSTTEGQAAEPDKLIDASSVDMSALGSMGGMGGFGGGGGRRDWAKPNDGGTQNTPAPSATSNTNNM